MIDKPFDYNLQLSEYFEYVITMKNGSMDSKLKMQERVLQQPEKLFIDKKKNEVLQSGEKENKTSSTLDRKQKKVHFFNQKNNSSGAFSIVYLLIGLEDSNSYDIILTEVLQAQKRKKKEIINKKMID